MRTDRACGSWERDESYDERCDESEGPGRLAREVVDDGGPKVAHELKNALTGIKVLVQLGLRNQGEAPSHARLAIIESELARMQELLSR